MTDSAALKSRLREYLTRRGVEIITTDAPRVRCLSGQHSDEHASMIVYERARGAKADMLFCAACGARFDIFDAAAALAGLPSGAAGFSAAVAEVRDVLGLGEMPRPAGAQVQQRSRRPVLPPGSRLLPAAAPHASPQALHGVALALDDARHVYAPDAVRRLASASLRAQVDDIEGTWPSVNPDGTIALVECRFPAACFADGKKKYLTIYFDGAKLRAKDPPILLYNRDKLAASPSLPVVIHEGPKAIFGQPARNGRPTILGAEAIPGYVHTGWNSGGKKWALCDFESLRGRTVIIYPDDDEPGARTALELAARLETAYACAIRICPPLPEARALKPCGADIVEALRVRSPEEMAFYLANAGTNAEN